MDKMDQAGLKLSAAPLFFVAIANMASVTLLRLLKSSVAQYLEVEYAKDTLFLGINIVRRLSLEKDDAAAKMVTVLSQLWNSDKAFRRPDSSEHTALRIRTRLAMSPVFDTIWWYREEFGGQPNAYPVLSTADTQTMGKKQLR